MLSMRYSDPPETDAEMHERQKNGGTEPKNNVDITNYVKKYTWSGDSEQAARKLEFSIAYNTKAKDEAFESLDLKLGGFIYLFYREDEMKDEVKIFEGRIFYRKRATDSYSFEFACFDDMIYLAKSNIRAVVAGTVAAGIAQVCGEIGIPVGVLPAGLDASVDFIADDKSATEVLRMLLAYQEAANLAHGKDTHYLPICLDGKVNIIKKGERIEGYTATADVNVCSAEYSESVEDMVNRIKAVDDNGEVCQVFTINDDVQHFGMIQKIYKMQPPKKGETVDNIAAAKAKLKRVRDDSSLKGLGNIQCITGYSIEVQEEQLKGIFHIKSDTHTFERGIHTMELSLEYLPDTPETLIVDQSDYVAPVFSTSRGRMKRRRRVRRVRG
ncbi:hypothetical protein [uncultured Selenomonas sp.]|uniref:XkdQ/YqbQ family protein n=1 Tax=uncultured Selenomonas sp. TaxID=159275 RepID=UPI0028D1C7A4|nr:hypothetical protein [uncultured Selenomonas sp.]